VDNDPKYFFVGSSDRWISWFTQKAGYIQLEPYIILFRPCLLAILQSRKGDIETDA
jgi:hypothetical protein